MNKPPVATVDIESFAHGGEGMSTAESSLFAVPSLETL